MSGEIVLSEDLNVITAEINSYKQVAGQAIFEIGRRLKHVKENDLVHGEWEDWLRTIDMTRQHAHRFTKVYEEFGESNVTPMLHLGINALYQIATLPEEEREKEHITSKGETKTVDEMTVRELEEVKRNAKEAEKRAQQAEQQLKEEQNKKQKVVEKEVIKEIDNTDYDQIEILKQQLTDKNNELESLSSDLNNLKENTGDFQRLKENLHQLHRDKEKVEEQIESATSLSTLVVDVEDFIQDRIGGIKYSRATQERLDSYVVQKNLKRIGNLLIEAGNDVLGLSPEHKNEGNIIDVEIV